MIKHETKVVGALPTTPLKSVEDVIERAVGAVVEMIDGVLGTEDLLGASTSRYLSLRSNGDFVLSTRVSEVMRSRSQGEMIVEKFIAERDAQPGSPFWRAVADPGGGLRDNTGLLHPLLATDDKDDDSPAPVIIGGWPATPGTRFRMVPMTQREARRLVRSPTYRRHKRILVFSWVLSGYYGGVLDVLEREGVLEFYDTSSESVRDRIGGEEAFVRAAKRYIAMGTASKAGKRS